MLSTFIRLKDRELILELINGLNEVMREAIGTIAEEKK